MKKITLLFALLISAVFANAQCDAPTGVALSDMDWDWNPSLLITWDANGATQWDVEWGLMGFVPTGNPQIEVLNNAVVNLNDFSLPETSYIDIYIRADCDGDLSDWVGPYTFYTYCTDELYYGAISESFETGEFSTCWMQANEGTPLTGTGLYGASAWEISDFVNNPSLSLSAKVNISGTTTNEWLILPLMKGMPGVKTWEDDFYYASFTIALTGADSSEMATLGSDDVIQMLISTDFGVSWRIIQTWDASTSISSTGDVIEIAYLAYGDDYDLFQTPFLVAFWASSGSVDDGANVDFFIDNINADAPITSGVSDLVSKGFTLYPNPSKNSIHLSAKETINHIEIYNQLGQKVKQTTLNTLDAQLDIAILPKGIYFMKVQIGETSGIVSLLKE